ncbi:enoyl-CoA hydratase/isomerase family protein [Oricola sp.]|uniref:enoyl-CoA hydratase/isomerase family protein n=1 Tax=Oricola sp. TaxID=1979950 RepID=UPI0025FBE4AE|nr:enoyl-CoA hydratase/isomerase family protein [Oricola sp.]MCI5075385.1 enoyl-CoA hydratase/isomerase family protein [Oricola sp.]
MADHLIEHWPEEDICCLRLNRPEKYNALSSALTDDLHAAMAGINERGARVLLLTANGKGFCAGADLSERKTMSDDRKFAHNRAISGLADDIAALPFPTIAGLNGLALGGGCEIALACDLRFMVANAKIGLTEARIGAIPGAGGTQRLPRLIGTARALEMMYSGEPIDAGQAETWGLVNRTFPDAAAMEAAMLGFARLVSQRSRRGMQLLKSVVYAGLDLPIAEGLDGERIAISEILRSRDYREGVCAFAERRSPVFD